MSDIPRASVKPLSTYSTAESHETAIGALLLSTSRGQVKAVDAPGLTTMLFEKADDTKSVGVLVYIPGSDPNETGTGMIAQVNPETARRLSASFAHLADLAEGKE